MAVMTMVILIQALDGILRLIPVGLGTGIVMVLLIKDGDTLQILIVLRMIILVGLGIVAISQLVEMKTMMMDIGILVSVLVILVFIVVIRTVVNKRSAVNYVT